MENIFLGIKEKNDEKSYKPPGKAIELLGSAYDATAKGLNWFVDTLDNLNRGGYAVANLTKAIQDGQVNGLDDAWKAMADGASLRKKTSFVDVVKDVIPGDYPFVETSLGFAGDVFIDPINLATASNLTKVKDLLKMEQIVEGSQRLTKIKNTMTAAGKALSRTAPIDWAGEAFIPGWKLRDVPGAYDKWRDLQLKLNFIRRNVKRDLTERWDAFRSVAKGLGLDANEEAAKLIYLHELGEGSQVRKEFKEFYDEIAGAFEEMADRELKAGLLEKGSIRDFYFPHILERGTIVERDGKLIVKKQKGFFTSLKFRGKTSFSLQRQYDTMEELKEGLFKLRNDKGLLPDVAPIENWFRGYAVRRFVSESALAWKQFTDEAIATWGIPLDEFMKANKIMPDEDIGKLAVKALHKGASLEEAANLADRLSGVAFEQGLSFVTSAANLRAPKMTGTILKAAKQQLMKEKGVMDTLLQEGAIDELSSLYKVFKKQGGRGVVTLTPEDVKALKGKGVFLFPSAFAKEIKDTFKVFSTSKTTREFIGTYDKALHIWKSMATSMRIPFHARNAISNTWLMYLGGVSVPKMPKRIADAGLAQLSAMRKDSKFMFQGFTGDELIRIADRYGVRAYGWMGADVPTQLQKELHIIESRGKVARTVGGGENPYNPFQYWARAGRKVGSGIEDNARLAVFMDQMKKRNIRKGMSIKQFNEQVRNAANHTKKYMFDYTELTDFERGTMKRIMPFYTWLRKNIPLQLESLLKQPHKYARLGDFERDVFPDNDKTPLEEKIMPRWMQEARFRKTDFVDDFGNPVYYSVDLPTKDLERMADMKNFIGALTPAVAVLQIATNTRFWPSAGKLSEPGQRVAAPFWADWLPAPIKKLADVNPTFSTSEGKMVLGMNPKWKYGLETAFPFLNDWARAYPNAGGFQVNVDGKWQKISYFTGVKFRPLDKRKAALAKYYKLREARQNLSKAARWQGKDLTRQKAQEIFQETMRQ